MSESPATRGTLLLRLRDRQDVDAWSEFIRDYGPMLYRFVRSRGLQDADAADVVQDVLRSVGMAISRLDYQKEKGGFRAWLFTITRNKLASFFASQKHIHSISSETLQFDSIDRENNRDEGLDQQLDQQWELEHKRQLAAKAMEQVKPSIDPKTWTAFELTAISELPAERVGQQLAMSKGAVYVARSRVIAKLRIEIERLLAEEG